jgi:predicted ArsR family transcriptional regulator
MSVKSSILSLFQQRRDLTIKEMVDSLQVSKQIVHRVINQLVAEHLVEKFGRSPKTIYRIASEPHSKIEVPEIFALTTNQLDRGWQPIGRTRGL